MKDSPSLKHLRDRYVKERAASRDLQTVGNELTRLAKSSIFALQRGGKARDLLEDARALQTKGSKIVQQYPTLRDNGPWRAGLEEYAEALLLEAFTRNDQKLFDRALDADADIVLGALSDLVGELARVAVREATDGNVRAVASIAKDAERIVRFLTDIDLTGPLRSKGDQARQHLRKIEDIRYDLSRRD